MTLLTTSFSLLAQNDSSTKNRKFKVYLNASYNNYIIDESSYIADVTNYYKYEGNNLNIGSLSFALEFYKSKKVSHEIEFMPISFSQEKCKESIIINEEIGPINGNRTSNLYSTARYQLNYHILKEKSIRPYIGLSPQLFYKFTKNEPFYLQSPINLHHEFSLLFAIIPGFDIKLNEKLDLNINIPITFLETTIEKSKINTPYRSYEDISNSELTGTFFPQKYNFRIGVSYLF